MSASRSSCSATSALRGSVFAIAAIIGTSMRATVCLPTYNECENLEPMLRALGEHHVRVLVIDDNSPDGTGRIADRLAQELDYVDVLHRPHKEGLGPADMAGGFKCYRADVLRTIDLDAIHSKGYAFQIETTYRTLRAGFTVIEVPIRFVDREVGGSKMSRAIVLEAMWKVPALRIAALTGKL